MMGITPAGAKGEAKSFLDSLASAISKKTPPGTAMERFIRRTIGEAKTDETKRHLRAPEAAFLNLFAVPALFDEIQAAGGLNQEQARDALLNEYHHSMPEFSKKGAYRAIEHPFKKVMAAPTAVVYQSWTTEDDNWGLSKCGPDFALRAPFSHRILFEGKYFSKGSEEYAGRELVKDIYQACFYRGLPPIPAKNGNAEWNYDYACLLAFDASPQHTLLTAWEHLGEPVRQSFWESANVYVMILGGQGEVPDVQS
jgi:hypothetical protein